MLTLNKKSGIPPSPKKKIYWGRREKIVTLNMQHGEPRASLLEHRRGNSFIEGKRKLEGLL